MAVMSLPDGLEDQADEPTPAVAKIRKHLRVIGDRVLPKTIPADRLTREEKREIDELPYPEDVDRPLTRGDCANMPRPCPFISCAHHLYLDVSPTTGAIKLNFPGLEPHEMRETCSLDIADRGGTTLEEIGRLYNVTRERVRQIQVRGLRNVARNDDGSLSLPVPRRDH